MRLTLQLICVLLMTVGFTGCSSQQDTSSTDQVTEEHDEDGHDHSDDHAGHDHDTDDHGGWWCMEHGVPESECPLCDTSLVAEFKAKDDWCDEHNRPDSQCFTCEPERFTRFAARYEAKYGEQPPQPTE